MMKKAFMTILTLGFVLALVLPSAYAADMDCGDFSTWSEAQKYFEDNSGSPTNNFNDLDRDHDGMACDSLAGAPTDWTWESAHPGGTTGGTQDGTTGAADKDCGDFSTWAEAQKYFEDNGGSPTNN